MVLRAVEQNAIDRSSLQQFDDDIQPFVLGGPKVDEFQNVGVFQTGDNLASDSKRSINSGWVDSLAVNTFMATSRPTPS